MISSLSRAVLSLSKLLPAGLIAAGALTSGPALADDAGCIPGESTDPGVLRTNVVNISWPNFGIGGTSYVTDRLLTFDCDNEHVFAKVQSAVVWSSRTDVSSSPNLDFYYRIYDLYTDDSSVWYIDHVKVDGFPHTASGFTPATLIGDNSCTAESDGTRPIRAGWRPDGLGDQGPQTATRTTISSYGWDRFSAVGFYFADSATDPSHAQPTGTYAAPTSSKFFFIRTTGNGYTTDDSKGRVGLELTNGSSMVHCEAVLTDGAFAYHATN